MKNRIFVNALRIISTLITILILFQSFTFAQEKIIRCTTKEAINYIGEEAIVTGVVADVFVSKKGNTFINFDGKYPKQSFTAVIFKDKKNILGDVYELIGKKVEIKGRIETYQGKPQIIMEKKEQLRITEEK